MREAVRFFGNQFQHLPAQQLPELNPFEQGRCPTSRGASWTIFAVWLNLSVMAARRGHSVLAVDANSAAIDHLRQRV